MPGIPGRDVANWCVSDLDAAPGQLVDAELVDVDGGAGQTRSVLVSNQLDPGCSVQSAIERRNCSGVGCAGVNQRLVLVRHQKVGEVVLRRRELIDRFFDGEATRAEGSRKCVEDLPEKTVLPAGGDHADAGVAHGRQTNEESCA